LECRRLAVREAFYAALAGEKLHAIRRISRRHRQEDLGGAQARSVGATEKVTNAAPLGSTASAPDAVGRLGAAGPQL
jgi:hypothetical protein